MIDAKQTLINLHTQLPELNLDQLFKILECIVEDDRGLTITNPITHPVIPNQTPRQPWENGIVYCSSTKQ